jgi:hypothetical protein
MMRMPGPRGGMTGGRTGAGRGSIAGLGAWRLNGLMMMGGMAGGADGGPLGPLLAGARAGAAGHWIILGIFNIPPAARRTVSIGKEKHIARPRLAATFVAPGARLACKKCSPSQSARRQNRPHLQYEHTESTHGAKP